MMERRRLLFRSDLTLDMPIFHSGLLLNSCSVLHPYSQETTESEASDLQQTGIIFPFQVDIATSRYVEKFEWSCGRVVARGPAKRKFKSLFFHSQVTCSSSWALHFARRRRAVGRTSHISQAAVTGSRRRFFSRRRGWP